MNIRSIFVNLPVKDIDKTRAFWTALGFGFDERFCDENALCLVLQEDVICAMLIKPELFSTFTHRPLADGTTTQVVLAIEVESRERVDEIIKKALEVGATHYLKSEENEWMYYDRFVDIDGHQWEVMFTDMSLLPEA